MNIVILGAGDIGSYLAQVLAKEHSVTLIDKDPIILEKISEKTDVATLLGYASTPGSDPAMLAERFGRRAGLMPPAVQKCF